MLRVVFLTFLLSFVATAQAAIEFYEFADKQQEQAYQDLIKELRCVVCQGQNLAESTAPVALELRQEIVASLGRGASKEEIINSLIKRYGEMILYKPPVQSNTLVLWALPFFLLVFVAVLGWRFIKSSQEQS